MAIVFNLDRSDPDHLPAATAICSFYAWKHGNDPTARGNASASNAR
jgi:hypothetical protein